MRAQMIALALAGTLSASPVLAGKEFAIFAGGCFWSVESNFDKVPGVLSTTSGYIGGSTANPTYYDHTSGGHREAVRIEFDNLRVSYDELLSAFFHSVDPTDTGGQFCDRGPSYTTAVYAIGDEQAAAAEKARKATARELKRELATEILAAPEFWPAEDYHQDYAKKNPLRYGAYREGCGRDPALRAVWGDKALLGIEKGS